MANLVGRIFITWLWIHWEMGDPCHVDISFDTVFTRWNLNSVEHGGQSRMRWVVFGPCKPCDARALGVGKATPFRPRHDVHTLSHGELRWTQLRRTWGVGVFWGLQPSVVAPWLRRLGRVQTRWPKTACFMSTAQWRQFGDLSAASRRKAPTYGSMVGPSIEHVNSAVQAPRFHRLDTLGLLK